MKEKRRDMFVLTDLEENYYPWDPWDGHLLQVSEEWTRGEELKVVEDVVDNIVCNLYWVVEEATKVYRNRDRDVRGGKDRLDNLSRGDG